MVPAFHKATIAHVTVARTMRFLTIELPRSLHSTIFVKTCHMLPSSIHGFRNTQARFFSPNFPFKLVSYYVYFRCSMSKATFKALPKSFCTFRGPPNLVTQPLSGNRLPSHSELDTKFLLFLLSTDDFENERHQLESTMHGIPRRPRTVKVLTSIPSLQQK